ncbi:MAG: hypothetical protein BWK79_10670 [Beggiatoa sp. IS2]|nr:MAG: hypothetical protein BWK79_10670 [Beggiatoa sp. IS2]
MRLLFKTILGWCFATSIVLATDLWVDANHGDDNHDGLTANTALRTLQAAAHLATAGTTVHIQPGVYRETIKPIHSGTPTAPIVYRAEQPGTVTIRGSATDLTWTPVTANDLKLPATVDLKNILWADVSAWPLTQSPRFLVQTATDSRLPLAREPDWSVQTEWQYHKFWWNADGGSAAASCYPPTDAKRLSCDNASRSATQLTDTQDDTLPTGVETGNLSTLGDLTGATVVALDTIQGRHVFRRTITAHEVATGRVTLDREAYHDTDPAFGWGSKYYVENHPALLDSPGEYWFDTNLKRLYVWATPADLANLEISQRDVGWDLSQLSYITLAGLTVELFNDAAILIQNDEMHSSHGIQLRNLHIHHANRGIVAQQTQSIVSSADAVINGLVLEDSEISDMDTSAIILTGQWDNASDSDAFIRPPITNTVIRRNELHHLGFRSQADDGVGGQLTVADDLRFENNHVHHVAHDGLQFSGSVIQSDKSYGFTPDEIKTGNILVKDNLIEKTCQIVVDCGGVRFVGTAPKTHVFRNVLIMGNTFRHIVGWSFVAEQRGRWANGYFGSGIYGDGTSGLHVYRNIAYDNGWAGIFLVNGWRDGVIIVANNVFADDFDGIDLWMPKSATPYNSVNTQILNNLLVNNENFGIEHSATVSDTQLIINHNLYDADGWGTATGAILKDASQSYPTLVKVQTTTPWEAQGISGHPSFIGYEYESERQSRGEDLNLNIVDFHLASDSVAIDRGTSSLPESLQTLLNHFDIVEEVTQQGTAWDIGAYESVPLNQSSSVAINIATQQPQETVTQFMGVVTTASGESGNGLTVTENDEIQVITRIVVDPQDVGQAANIVMVGAYTPVGASSPWYFLRDGTTWQVWDGTLTSLAVAETSASLPAQLDVNIFSGRFADLAGQYTVYVGYLLPTNVLVFNGPQTIQFTVILAMVP